MEDKTPIHFRNPKNIRISDYDYPLPEQRIAKFPLSRRDQSQLLVYKNGTISQHRFHDLPSLLPEKALMVFNNTKVIQARLHFQKDTGAHIEVFLLEPYSPVDYELIFQTRGQCKWICLLGNAKKWKNGTLQRIVQTPSSTIRLTATRQGTTPSGSPIVALSWAEENKNTNNNSTFADILDAIGELPIPPYLNRDTQETDKTTYQTVYSKIKGSVAAPTAGLHFTPEVLAAIDQRGIDREEVTLHVGAGTFRPVKSQQIGDHHMHSEYICVRRQTIQKLLQHHAQAIAVGTTSVRTLESLYYIGRKIIQNPNIDESNLHVQQWEPYQQPTTPEHNVSATSALNALLQWLDQHQLHTIQTTTQIIILPGYDYKIVNTLITNFHQPQSTLLLLVSAFLKGQWRPIYDYALNNGFRFLSYGDSSLLFRD